MAKELTLEQIIERATKKYEEKQTARAERKAEADKAKAEKRTESVEHVKIALEELMKVDEGKNELTCVINRLNMFINGERYTRTKGDKE